MVAKLATKGLSTALRVVVASAVGISVFAAATAAISWFGGAGRAGVGDGALGDGSDFSLPASIETASFDEDAAVGDADARIDVSHASEGYFSARAVSECRLKLQVVKDETYNYDLPSDGTPIIVPANMGNGRYTVCIMQNVDEALYRELASVEVDVVLDSETEPYLRPNVFVSYDESSEVVKTARTLVSNAATEGDAVRAILDYIVKNIAYDQAKADVLADGSGYVPNPDAVLSEGSAICFDYASLTAAMLRSVGIPCKVVTGYSSQLDAYHAWNKIYIDGQWIDVNYTMTPYTRRYLEESSSFYTSSGYVFDGFSYEVLYTY